MIAVVLVLACALLFPFVWEMVFKHAFADLIKPGRHQVLAVVLSPSLLTIILLYYITTTSLDYAIPYVISCSLFILIISTLTWGYAMYYRDEMRTWIWLIMCLITLCLYPINLLIIVYGTTSSWTI